MSAVELKDLRKRYGDRTVVSVDALRAEDGEFLALLGPSGCGKTTILRMIAGFTEPDEGTIHIGSKPMEDVPPHKRNIGVVFQSYALFPHLTIFDNVAFGLKMRHVAKDAVALRVRRALDMVKLAGMEDRTPRQLSGGQQQRVAIARALVIEPSILLLDEPLSNLDANLRDQMRFEIKEIQKRIGITTIFVTHDQQEAMAAADRLAIMSKGRLRQTGSPKEIYESPVDDFVATFIGQANLLPGQITSIDGVRVDVRLDGGATVFAPIRDTFVVGDKVSVAVRPGACGISRVPVADSNSLSGQVQNATYLGSHWQILLRTAGNVLVSTVAAEAPAGDAPVYLVWPASSGTLVRHLDESE